ncbi:MAG: pyrophosphate--fructose-6-phosphate 1-phosphotransferase [Puniceicoccales bacterium]|jgi:pyrophosphate--fructose-6-phosphate 1-phosphotransferase|nr:pyrophosphate--fructose-6-phosphate 1-phosphotransferase [Puniceicoccales bacterium]
MKLKKVAILTAGGIAPCLSSAVGGLIERYSEIAPDIEILCYLDGYKGLLLGNSIAIEPAMRRDAAQLHELGGTPIGSSRVKLSNIADCLKRGLVKDNENPLKVAADQLVRDGVQVLHTVGGDDTNTAAADLARYLGENGYSLTVIGLPKTVDNDVFPVKQSLGAWTAAIQSARFFENIAAEHSANPRMLIVHEVMGRNCGWLTAATADIYRKGLLGKNARNPLNTTQFTARRDVHAVYVPELQINFEAEAERLRRTMDEIGNVNIFVSEGAGVDSIVQEIEQNKGHVPRDAFGHVKLDNVNAGKWFADKLAPLIGAEKKLVQKSGYFARSAPACTSDLALIKSCVDYAVECALRGESGVVGHDTEHGGRLRAIEFPRIKGGRPFDIYQQWFIELTAQIGHPPSKPAAVIDEWKITPDSPR